MKLLNSIFIVLLSTTAMAQMPVDTVNSSNGRIVFFSDHSWKFIDNPNATSSLDDVSFTEEHDHNHDFDGDVEEFDGVMNERIQYILESKELNFIQPWNNDECYTSGRQNDMSLLKDTIWLCVNDSLGNGFHIPHPGPVTSHYEYRRRFRRYHKGIDIGLTTGDTIRAAWSGKIRYAKYNTGGFGNLVIIRHANGLETFYAHLSKHLVLPNDEVKAGDPIGLGGNTGHSYGAHLHFEVRFFDASINPEEIIDFNAKALKNENLFVHKGLFVPGAKPSDYYLNNPQAENVAAVTRSNASTVSKKYYKIRSGDTLSQIAARNNTTISKLCKLNGMRQTTTLQIGKSIRVR